MSGKWFQRLCGKLLSRRIPHSSVPHRTFLELEQLEDRLVPFAFTFTWRGGLHSTLWSNPANWVENRVPSNNDPEKDDVLVFPSGPGINPTSVNDIGNVSVSQIRIDSNDFTNFETYTISGGTITLSANASLVPTISDDGAYNELACNLQLPDTSHYAVFTVVEGHFFYLDGNIGGAGGFRKQGEGTLLLSGDNVYTGPTVVDQGALEVDSVNALGSSVNGTTVLNPGTLILSSFGGTEPLTLVGSGGTSNRGALTTAHGAGWDGDILLGSSAVVVRVDNFNGPVTLSLNGKIHGGNNGSNGLTKVGDGELVLGGAGLNDYTGASRVSDGTLSLTKGPGSNAITGPLSIGDNLSGRAGSVVVNLLADNQISKDSAITVNYSGTLNFNDHSDLVGAITLNGGQISTGTGVLTLNGNVSATSVESGGFIGTATISGNLSLGGAARSFVVFNGPGSTDLKVTALISGAVGLAKADSGRMRLTAANTYTGSTNVNGGILEIDGAQGSSATFVNIGATLAGNGTIGSLTVNAGGTVAPASGESLTVQGNASFGSSSANFAVSPIGNTVGTLGATRIVTLNNATLRISDSLKDAPQLNLPITVIGAGSLVGIFNGLKNSDIAVSSSGLSYRITYTSGSVILTRIQGPAFQQRAITSPIDEGSLATLTGHITTILPDDKFFLEVNWGDGGSTETFNFKPDAPRDVVLQHRYVDDGVYSVGLHWHDQRGSFNTDTLAVTVLNVAPEVNAGDAAQIFQGAMLARLITFTDPGQDAWTATVDFGDGTSIQTIDVRSGTQYLLRHRYADAGTFTVTVTVRDDDGDAGTTSFQVEVLPRPDATVLDAVFGLLAGQDDKLKMAK